MTEQALYVSLGHNASAAFAENGRVVRAYEQERIDRKKSSSAYPREAIELAMGKAGGADVAYVSHWFDDLELKSNKYLDLDHLRGLAPEIVTLSDSFTHHDAHASSALSFFRSNGGRCEEADVVVLDGFGTSQECLSVYRAAWPFEGRPRHVHRTYGYAMSLGLMYQYVTEYLGMKPNQDEYKLLGYESHILKITNLAIARELRGFVAQDAQKHVDRMLDATTRPERAGGLIDYESLKQAKAAWWKVAEHWRILFRRDLPDGLARTAVAFCAQWFIEECAVRLVERLLPPTPGRPAPQLVLAGGCFYNVKLSRRLRQATGRRVFSHPLAGDQGAPLGFTPGLDCSGLNWGARAIQGRHGQLPPGVEVVDPDAWVARAATLLDSGRIVNVVRGGMEFGPRALCNTTTLARPTRDSVARINALNERDEAMPMAPALTRKAAMSLFRHDELFDVSPSDRFMITTVAFDREPPDRLMGVAHNDPLFECWTARPQVVDEGSDMATLLRQVPNEVLINTSFNYHGEPIVFTEDDACKTHAMQCFRAQQLGVDHPVTLLVRSEP